MTAVTRTLRMPVVSRLYRLASVKHADTCGLVLLFGIVVGFSDDRRLLVLILLVFFVLVVIIIVVWVSRRQCIARNADRQPGGKVLEDVRGHVGSIRDVTPLDRESSNRACPVRESVALDRSKRPPRQRGTAGHLSGRDDPRAARPLGASLRVRQLGAPSGRPVNAIRHRGSCRCRSVPRLGVVMLNDPAPAKRGEIEDGTKKAFLTSDARMGIGTEGKGIRAMFEVYSRIC